MIEEIVTLWIDKSDFYIGLLVEHIQITVCAIVLAICIGLVIGVCLAEFKKVSKIGLHTINFMYTIPSISLLGFLIPFSGIGNTTAIIALTLYALLPMVRSTYTGLNNVSPLIVEAAQGMGSTRWQMLYKVKLPLALPIIMNGIRNMAVMTIALAGIASFIGAGGLGVAIYRGITTNNKAMTVLGSLLIALLALIVDWLLGVIEKRTQRRTFVKKKRMKFTVFSILSICIVLIVSMMFMKSDKQVIHVATKPMSEQYIIGEMLKSLIESKSDYQVEITQGVGGGTSNIHPAMLSKEFDIYPEYTGTGWSHVLKRTDTYSEEIFDQLQAGYHDMGLKWESMLGFNNTFSIAVRKEIADTYNLKTYSDLQKIANQLTFGGQYDFFERADGFDALCKAYNLSFKNTMDLDISLKYDALRQNKIDVATISTTDGQLNDPSITVLQDDKNLYPSYLCGLVIREEIVQTYPELVDILALLQNSMNDQDMASMNYQVETEKKEPKEVAENFLKSKGLLGQE